MEVTQTPMSVCSLISWLVGLLAVCQRPRLDPVTFGLGSLCLTLREWALFFSGNFQQIIHALFPKKIPRISIFCNFWDYSLKIPRNYKKCSSLDVIWGLGLWMFMWLSAEGSYFKSSTKCFMAGIWFMLFWWRGFDKVLRVWDFLQWLIISEGYFIVFLYVIFYRNFWHPCRHNITVYFYILFF